MKQFKVMKYTINETSDCGILPESDVEQMLRYYKYDKDLDLWFSRKATIAYSVEEVK